MRDRHGRRRSPDERRRSPDERRKSPEERRRSPDERRRSPDERKRSPEDRRRSPEDRRRSPEDRRRSPDERRRSPEERRRSPEERRRSPEDRRRKRSPEGRSRRSPEVEKKTCKRRKRMEERARQERSSPPQNETRPKSRFERESEKWGKTGEEDTKKKPKVNVAKPDFGLSGKLAEETNTYHGVVIKYAEPPEAGKPKRRWRLYPFKGNDVLPTLYIHRQSAYLIGRDRKVADLPIDHPSCSKQHAALQYRIVPYTREDGLKSRRIRPYIIDLDSANGTFINGQKIESRKYVELMERDVIKFAFSSREYVLLHEHSQDDDAEEDDNVNTTTND